MEKQVVEIRDSKPLKSSFCVTVVYTPGLFEQSSLTRIAIVEGAKCKPKKCRQECKKGCPVVRMGKMCIEVAPTSKVSEGVGVPGATSE